ncbi:MAG: RNA-binding protein AU-1 [Candidatus Bathyarchaeota archaeon BA1]|nr:MAG: RNA-binding protein AU-1 [Candidatus Bathyarchaeota archaeon BA1]
MENFKVRIRGIYSTALTKLLLDHGFDVVQPSVTIKERFGLEEREESPDLDVNDRRDLQGVRALGKADCINAFKSILQSCLDDVIVRKWAVTVDGTYKGLVKGLDPPTHSILVDIGPAVGRVAEEEIPGPNLRQLVVQVDRRRIGAREPALTTGIKIPGKYAILIPGRQVKVSRRIRNWESRSRLYQLGEKLAPANWGILWRTASADQPPDILKEEIACLVKEGEAIMERARHVEAPAMLWEGNHLMDVEFPAPSKRKLDEVRGSVVPTIDGHHYYKACGDRVSSALEMAERLLEKGYSRGEVEELFQQTIEAEYPTIGTTIQIEHVKLNGRVFHLGKALVEDYDHDQSMIRFSRVFKREGTYNGLKTRKEPGDQAITEARIGDWHFKTKYFSRDGQYKGTYINLNTPIELYPYGIRYLDLEVDICIWPDGGVKTLDEEKLEKAVLEGLVTEKLVRIVKEKLQEIIKGLSP